MFIIIKHDDFPFKFFILILIEFIPYVSHVFQFFEIMSILLGRAM